MKVTVREGVSADITPMVTMGKRMHEESVFAKFNWNDAKVTQFGKLAVSRDDTCFYVAEVDGVRAGMIIGALVPYYFGDDLQLGEYLWYVAPEYRGTSAGIRLVKKFIEFGKAHDVKEVCMGVSTGITPDTTGKLLQRLGFDSIGGIFKYGVGA
jgi:ribosomal protein S18 acetylase RimI-like enzyme